VFHDPVLLDALERFDAEPWEGVVFRHVLGQSAPDRPNVRGARWNPPEVSALYVSLDHATATAEGNRILEVQSVRPRVTRFVYELGIRLDRLLDLSDEASLDAVGISEEDLRADSFESCQRVGGAVAWGEHDGLLVPSIRREGGQNLVIFTANQAVESELEIRGRVEIPA
jgi:RES domain-containing protein